MGIADALLQRMSRRTRAAVVAVVAVAVGSVVTTAVAGQVVSPEPAAVVTRIEVESSAPLPPSAPPIAVALPEQPAVVSDPAADVRRARIGPPRDYPGSLHAAPIVAVMAYQRAAAIINATVPCRLDWLVLAAIARVESNHGRGADLSHRITRAGRITPALVDRPLNGKQGRGRLSDTDRGRLDLNQRWDAPIGPLGFLPTIWAKVAVDADNDATRNPQDLDDAALAAAVLLCAGEGTLAKARPLREALASFHRAPGFVRTVLALMRRYEKQAATVPVYVPPPGGVVIPEDMPKLCDCAPARTRQVVLLDIAPTRGRSPRDPGRSAAEGSTVRPTDPTDPTDP
ncbi:lytic transglycosylase domain-containing protein, partial [Nocardioides sp.]